MRGSLKSHQLGANIAELLSQAADLSNKAATLAQQGRVIEALSLEREADVVREQARRAASRLEPEESTIATGAITHKAEVSLDRGPNARATTIAALGELGVPSAPRAIADYAWARYGMRIDHRALPSLRRDEIRSWNSSKSVRRPVYIVPALEGNRFLPVRAKLALSEWSLERRLLGPWSERADHLRAAIQMAKQIAWLSSIDPHGAKRVASLLATHSGGPLNVKAFDPAKAELAAAAELDAIQDEDRRWREEAAERARQFLSEENQLWGASLPRIVTEGA